MSAIKRWQKKQDGTKYQEETYTVVFRWQGKQKWIPTGHTIKADAEAEERTIRKELAAGRIPDLLRKLRQRADATLTDIVHAYIAANCPDGDLRPRIDAAGALNTTGACEKRNLEKSLEFWASKDPKAITTADCDDFWQWRRDRSTRGVGNRITELELQSLANAFAWAVRTRRLEKNPLEKRPRYCDPKKIRHARDCMPGCADEFHQLAAAMLSHKGGRSAVNGWAYLLAGVTGLRCEEMRLLRTDARRIGLIYQPGYMDEQYLHVHRCKHGRNPRVKLDDPTRPHIRTVLDAILSWKARQYPLSPWLLPGRGGRQLSEGSVVHCLEDTIARLKLFTQDGDPIKRTAHGARAYYCTVRLCHGIEPETIAREVGQSSGDDLIRTVYGADPDDFHVEEWKGLADRYTWTPVAPMLPAWDRPLEPDNIVTLLAVNQ